MKNDNNIFYVIFFVVIVFFIIKFIGWFDKKNVFPENVDYLKPTPPSPLPKDPTTWEKIKNVLENIGYSATLQRS